MPSRDVNAATRLAEASWRRDNTCYSSCATFCSVQHVSKYAVNAKLKQVKV